MNKQVSPAVIRLVRGVAATLTIAMLLSGVAGATITQGDFSIFGNFRAQWAGRWGEGSDRTKGVAVPPTTGPVGFPAARSGGSFDFNHWDLVEAKGVVDIRPDYHLVKNYNFLNRMDTILIKDADFFAIYRGWYDAEGDLKRKGISQPFNDYDDFSRRAKDEYFKRDDLREYYVQLNVTDDLSFRIGKQEIIWSEADALSGTEVLNPADLRYHWTHFESPEDLRRNIRMVKMNYALGDFWKTANNEFEAFWIPGDFQGVGPIVNIQEKRLPYFAQVATGPYNPLGATNFTNQEGQPTRAGSLADGSGSPLGMVNLGAAAGLSSPVIFLDFSTPRRTNTPSNSPSNSEFGARYSTLLPIGNGLQVSLIYEWLFRAEKTGVDPSGGPPPCVAAGTCFVLTGPTLPIAALNKGPGIWATINVTAPNATYRTRPGGLPVATLCGPDTTLVPGLGNLLGFLGAPVVGGVFATVPTARCGQLFVDLFNEIVRANFFGLTGTYYDKDLTDIVFRYDFAYLPKTNYFGKGQVTLTPGAPAKGFTEAAGKDQGDWTDKFEGILAFDRPTYIPWISKQHTFLVLQQTTQWFPGAHQHPLLSVASVGGKFRTFQNLGLLAAVDYLLDGRLVSTNAFAWDEDDQTGFISSTNAFRYSRNILFDFNVQWYLGRSGRYTDPFLFSRDQRINETEFRIVYEI